MESKEFTFYPAKIVEKDISMSITPILDSTDVTISDESTFILIKNLLSQTPLRLLYEELDKSN